MSADSNNENVDISSQTSTKSNKLPKNMWMVRSCHLYDDEYSDCTSIRDRFQQYFVHGHLLDCTSWKHDYLNCLRWKQDKDITAIEKVIASEESRRQTRLNPHYNNPVWEDRSEPPADWNAPLPPFLAEKQQNTYLALKSKEMKEGKEIKVAERFCPIM